jgi:DNA-binding NtrC family response regulator
MTMWETVDNLGWNAVTSDAEDLANKDLTGRVLVIDDDPHFLRVLSRILTAEKFKVTTAAEPCEAIDLLRTEVFDVVISDLRMPECDGLNLLQAVRGAGNTVPVIILTAYGEVDTYLEAMNAGATEYLSKPIKSDELVKVVRSCLRKSNAHKDPTGESAHP